MENQNNNKNGLLGLAILIGIALLVAVFCSPLVAHAETVPRNAIKVINGLAVSTTNIGFTSTSLPTDSTYEWYYFQERNSDVYFVPFKTSSNSYGFAFISRSSFKLVHKTNYWGSWGDEQSDSVTSYTYNGNCLYMYARMGGITSEFPWHVKLGYTDSDIKLGLNDYLFNNANDGLSGSPIYDPSEKGTEDNPEYDEEIGALQLKDVAFVKSNFLNLPSWLEGAVIPQVMANFFSGDYLVEWKNTTSTGLSLNYYEEKYGKLQYEYFLECRCSYLNIGGSVGDQFPSYGNRSPIRYQQGSVKHISLKASDILDSIEGVKDDWSKCLYDKKEFQLKFRLYIRPKFTQSLTVIPDSSDNAKWVCGRWCAVDLKFRDIVLGNDSHAETGEFNEDDVWCTDDDTGTDINSGMINADSVDEALDKLHSYEDIDISDYIKNLNAFSEEVKNIPIIIGKLLSFLPPWVPILIGILIGTCCVVGILRILRG